MKRIKEVLHKLNAQEKAWIKIWPLHHNKTLGEVRQKLFEKTGEDIAPDSIEEYLKSNAIRSLRPSIHPRAAADRRAIARRNLEEQLARSAEKAEREGDFDPKNIRDGRQKAIRGITLRRGQLAFRKKLLEAYGSRCAVTGCDCSDTLEAAHIVPYCGEDTNHIQNGLLLRSDIHTLFDMGKIGIDPLSHNVIVSKSLSGTVYQNLNGKKSVEPSDARNRASADALQRHLDEWGLRRK